MKLTNIRLGFATNSSSTHSIVILPSGAKARDDVRGDFGWDTWTASSADSKSLYLAILIRDTLMPMVGRSLAVVCAESLTGKRPDDDDDYVDHQSAFTIPAGWTGQFNEEYAKALVDVLRDPRVAILGGNDNSDSDHYLLSESKALDIGQCVLGRREGTFMPNVVARHESGPHWTLFDRDSGSKVRVALSVDPVEPVEFRRSPELIDVKITDQCHLPKECAPFCYQSATASGLHADLYKVHAFAYQCREHEVFEVALGGGEPTMHPSFVNILQSFASNHVVVNFTTRSLAWLDKKAEILPMIGGFAVSVSRPDEVDPWAAALTEDERRKCSLQVVMGVTPMSSVIDIIRRAKDCGIPRVTLLGYKTVGRGLAVKPNQYSDWLDKIKTTWKYPPVAIGIDTALAASSADAMEKHGVPNWLYRTAEGESSMYVDLVKHTASPSSFSPHVVPYGGTMMKSWLEVRVAEAPK